MSNLSSYNFLCTMFLSEGFSLNWQSTFYPCLSVRPSKILHIQNTSVKSNLFCLTPMCLWYKTILQLTPPFFEKCSTKLLYVVWIFHFHLPNSISLSYAIAFSCDLISPKTKIFLQCYHSTHKYTVSSISKHSFCICTSAAMSEDIYLWLLLRLPCL